jgi:hypothetical protein
VPHSNECEQRGYADREAWLEAGKLELSGGNFPRSTGSDIKDFNANMTEEVSRHRSRWNRAGR